MTEDWKIFFDFMENPTRAHEARIDAQLEEEERTEQWQRATNPDGNWPTITRPKPVRGGMPDIPVHTMIPFGCTPVGIPCNCPPTDVDKFIYDNEGRRVQGTPTHVKKPDARSRYQAIDDDGYMCKHLGASKQTDLGEMPIHGPHLSELTPIKEDKKPTLIHLADLHAKRAQIQARKSARIEHGPVNMLHGPFLLELRPLPRTKRTRKGLHGPTLHTPE